jgi:hypothetical protein
MASTANQAGKMDLERPALPRVDPLCPVDRLPRRRRNQICIAVLAIGLLNFMAYTLIYAILGGDAHNGARRIVQQSDGTRVVEYYVRGHFIRSSQGREARVDAAMWVYSYVHSISMWLTAGAMIVSALILARPHIIATMRDSWIRGETFVTVFGTVAVVLSCSAAFVFTWDFIRQLLA